MSKESELALDLIECCTEDDLVLLSFVAEAVIGSKMSEMAMLEIDCLSNLDLLLGFKLSILSLSKKDLCLEMLLSVAELSART